MTSQPWITWYGPIECGACGQRRRCLRQVGRRIDLDWLFKATGLKTEEAYRSAMRERDEVLAAIASGHLPGGNVPSRRKSKGARRR
ncbi:MAG: hypothetical protein KDB00_10865 [Planctomycetales bacterium]|nr:hypothetical protein [Planctomycetales bacterium]